jgi:hypothetical protein
MHSFASKQRRLPLEGVELKLARGSYGGLYNLAMIYICIEIASSSGPSAPSSHERMGHSRSLGCMKGFMMENVQYDRKRYVTLGSAPQYYPFSLGGENMGLGHKK